MFKQPQLQIGRDYTPLPPIRENSEHFERSANADESLRFLIRRDPHGEVSRYLHGLQPGATVEVRGPQPECYILPDVHDILFIAGGTGIAPALQAAYTLLRRTADDHLPRIHILWANRKREDSIGGVSDSCTDVPAKSSWWTFGRPTQASTTLSEPSSTSFDQGAIVEELQILKSRYPGQITVDYFVDEENSFVSTKEIGAFTQGRAGDQRKMIIVSGPEGFVNYMAGPKLWAQGQELQGPIQGIIKELDLRGWTVWKL
jgi:homoaconitate hydratase